MLRGSLSVQDEILSQGVARARVHARYDTLYSSSSSSSGVVNGLRVFPCVHIFRYGVGCYVYAVWLLYVDRVLLLS